MLLQKKLKEYYQHLLLFEFYFFYKFSNLKYSIKKWVFIDTISGYNVETLILSSSLKKGFNPLFKFKINTLNPFSTNPLAIKVVTLSVPPDKFRLPIKTYIFHYFKLLEV